MTVTRGTTVVHYDVRDGDRRHQVKRGLLGSVIYWTCSCHGHSMLPDDCPHIEAVRIEDARGTLPPLYGADGAMR